MVPRNSVMMWLRTTEVGYYQCIFSLIRVNTICGEITSFFLFRVSSAYRVFTRLHQYIHIDVGPLAVISIRENFPSTNNPAVAYVSPGWLGNDHAHYARPSSCLLSTPIVCDSRRRLLIWCTFLASKIYSLSQLVWSLVIGYHPHI